MVVISAMLKKASLLCLLEFIKSPRLTKRIYSIEREASLISFYLLSAYKASVVRRVNAVAEHTIFQKNILVSL